MKSKVIIIIGFLVVLALVFSSCASNKQSLKENEALTSDLNAARARISDLEAQLKAKDQEVQDLEAHIQSKEDELLSLQGELARSQEDARELEIQVVSKEEEIAALERNVDELASSLPTSGDDQSKMIAQLNDRKNALERQVASLKSDLDAANRKNEQLDSEIGDLNSQIDTLTSDKGSLEEELAVLKAREDKDKARLEMTRDELVNSLEQEIEDKTVEIQQYKNALTILVMDRIFFDSGKAVIKPTGYDLLDRIADAVQKLPEKVIRVEGHTDDVPIGPKIKSKYPSNWELGAARSSAVARYFIDKHNIDPERIVAISYSKYRPVVPNDSDENRAKNRRIEIVLTDRSLYELMEMEESSVAEAQ